MFTPAMFWLVQLNPYPLTVTFGYLEATILGGHLENSDPVQRQQEAINALL